MAATHRGAQGAGRVIGIDPPHPGLGFGLLSADNHVAVSPCPVTALSALSDLSDLMTGRVDFMFLDAVALELPEVRSQLLNMGVDASPMTVTALNAMIAKDEQRLGALVKTLGLKAN